MSEPIITPEHYGEEYWMGRDHKPTISGYFDYQEGSTHSNDAKALMDVFDLKGKRVLDVGCCFGFQVKHLNLLGADARGCDFSRYAVEKSYEGQGYPPKIIWADIAAAPPYDDGAFDFVFSFATFEHIPEEGIVPALENVRRMLKPGGRFLVYPEVYGMDDPPRSATEDKTHITRKSREWWVRTLVSVFPEGLADAAAEIFVEQCESARRWKWSVFVTNPKI